MVTVSVHSSACVSPCCVQPSRPDRARRCTSHTQARLGEHSFGGDRRAKRDEWGQQDRDGSVLAFSNTTRGTCTVRFGATPFSLGGEQALMQRLDDGLARGPMMVDRGGYQWVTSLRTAFTSIRLGLLRDESGGSPEVNDCW